ncbi:MAG: M48 family metallopeptidase [Rhodocyclaceae bacterium]
MARCLLGGALVWGLVACQTVQTTQPGTVGVDRKQTVSPLINRNELTQTAALEYRQTLQQAGKKGALDQNKAMTERVQRIANRLIPQVAVFRPDAQQWKWETHVITSNELNAWCMPGGKIAVYSGLIEKLKLTDDELAAVMGHEISHALREHAWERASQAANANLGLSVAGALLGVSSGGMDMAGLVYQVTFELPNSRGQETEADRMGVELAARAGYDPRAAIALWQKMSQADSGGAPPKFMSTHPPSAERQADLADYAQRVMPLYEAARGRATK